MQTTCVDLPRKTSGASFTRVVALALAGYLLSAAAAHAGHVILDWDASPETFVAGYVVYYGTAPGVYTDSVDVGNTTVYTLNGLPNGVRFYFAVRAYSTSGRYSESSNEVNAVAANAAPTIVDPGSFTVREGALAVPIAASDPDFDVLTYSASGLPAGMAISSVTGLISGSIPAGIHTITARVSDGVASAAVTFVVTATVNTAPTLADPGDRSNDTDDVVSLQLMAADAELDPLTYSATGLPAGLTLNASTGRITGTPLAGSGGSHAVTVSVSDGAWVASRAFTWTIIDLIPGLFSHWMFDAASGTAAVDSVGARHGTLTNGAVWATGHVGNAVALDGVNDYVALPAFDVTGSGMTIAAWVRSTTLSSAVDQRFVSKASSTLEQDHYWMLGQTTVSGVPRLRFRLKTGGATTTLVAASGTLPLNTWYHVAATYDGAVMRVYLNGVEVGTLAKTGSLSTNAGVGVSIGRSPDGSSYMHGSIDDVRLYTRGLSAAEIQGVLTAAAPTPDSPPVLTSPGNRSSAEGDVVSVAITASDPDDDPITYSAAGLPAGLAMNATTGVISGTLTYASAGTHAVTLTATAGGASDAKTITWTVTNTNRAPVATNPGAQTSFLGIAVSLALTAVDADGDPLTFSASGLPGGLSINATTGVVSGTPAAIGSFGAVVTVSDGTATNAASFAWSVVSPLPGAATPLAPSGTISSPTPTFTWTAVPNVGYYFVSITDANPASPTGIWYTPAQAGCAAGTGTCTMPAPRPLSRGLVSWGVLTWNVYGYGPWSPTKEAILDGVDPTLAAPGPIAPSGPIATRTPTYRWSPVSGATWYQIATTDAIGTTIESWHAPGSACASSDCSATPSMMVAVGPAQWRVRAWSAAGAGAWSSPMEFEAASGLPGKATLIAPIGGGGSSTPAFSWNAVSGVSYYMARITDRDGVIVDRWYRPSQVGCPHGTGTCSASPGIVVPPGPAAWQVLTWNAAGYGPWSDPGLFSVDIADPLAGAPAVVSPTGVLTVANATYQWTAVAGAVNYRLSIRNNAGAEAYWWYTPSAAGCAGGSTCAATPIGVGMRDGTAEWRVQAWTVNGYGAWSAPAALTVSIPKPVAPVLLTPSGAASPSTTFTWNPSANATLYYVRASDSSGVRVDRWLTPDQVGCANETSACILPSGVTLSAGTGTWQALAWNPTGYSAWAPPVAFIVP